MRTLFTVLGLATLLASAGTPSFAEEAKPQEPVKRYKVIVRVVRPTLTKTPDVQEARANLGKYSHIANSVFHPKNPESDEELLKKLNKHNPQFKFDRIISKRVLEVEADALWDIPAEISPHHIRLAIVDKNLQVMDTKRQELLKSSDAEEAKRGKSLEKLSFVYTPETLQKIKAENKTLLYLHTMDVYSKYENKTVSIHGGGNGGRAVDNGTTFCLTSDIYCIIVGNNSVFKLQWASTDVVILTILSK